MVKLGYQINAHHRIAFGFTGQKGERYTDERSYALYGGSWREANDENKRHNFNVSYIYAPDSAWLAFAKLNLDYQKN